MVTALGELSEILAIGGTEEGPAFTLQADSGVASPALDEPLYDDDVCGIAVYSIDKVLLPGGEDEE